MKTEVDFDSGGDTKGTGGNLVLPEGKAWTDFHEHPDMADGYIFRDDGTYFTISNWDGSWEIETIGTYSVNDGQIIFDFMDGMALSYSVTGDALAITVMGFPFADLRVTDVGILSPPPSLPPSAPAKMRKADAHSPKIKASMINKAKLKLPKHFTKK